MGCVTSGLRFCRGLTTVIFALFCVPPAFALSDGCSAVNTLSGSTSLSFGSHRFRATDFAPGDALTLSFTDSGAAAGDNVMNADSLSVATYNLTHFQTYNAATTSTDSPHTVTLSVPAGSLESNGLRVRATTAYGQISNLVFHCSNASSESDAPLP